MKSFEELFDLARRLEEPIQDDQRTVDWCDEAQVIGLARQQGGAYEIFIRCSALHATRELVGRHLKHDCWQRVAGEAFEANRLVFPTDPHFVPVAAFLAEELLRSGASTNPQRAFSATEPLIEMALRRTALTEESLLGLLGELRLLEVLLRTARTAVQRAASLEAWRGYERTSRDFVFPGRAEVEVKVTRSEHSLHHITSIGQVDPRRTAGGDPIEQLYLLSIGLTSATDADEGESFSLPSQVEAVLALLGPMNGPGARNEIQELFLAKVERYGAASRHGYRHDEMSTWPVYRVQWVQRFGRAYDMNSDRLEVLRLSDIERRRHVSPETVSFIIDLPDNVEGEDNPQTDLTLFATALIL